MNNQKRVLQNPEKKDEVLEKIKELIPKAPASWKESIADRMGKSIESITKYVAGGRGMKSGYHKDVLMHLKQLVAEEDERTKELLS